MMDLGDGWERDISIEGAMTGLARKPMPGNVNKYSVFLFLNIKALHTIYSITASSTLLPAPPYLPLYLEPPHISMT